MRCYKFHFQKEGEHGVCTPTLWFPRASAEPFVFFLFTMGKYLKQISCSACAHQCRNTWKCCGVQQGCGAKLKELLVYSRSIPKCPQNGQIKYSREDKVRAACDRAATRWTGYEKDADTLRFFRARQRFCKRHNSKYVEAV